MIIQKIFGPPGTGKTTYLMARVMESAKQGTPLHRIGYVSFSRAAAEVIRERMGATETDTRWFKTIHATALKSMGMGGAVIDYHDYQQFSAKYKMRISTDEDELELGFNPAMRVHQLALNTMRPAEEIIREQKFHECLVPRQFNAFVEAWAQYKKDVRKFDFTDMLVQYNEHGTPLPLDEIYLDEAQDLSELQWRVFRKMMANCKRVYLTGDDDQNIFPFIGGSAYGFLDFKADEEVVLHKSFRVPHNIGAEADRIIRHVEKRKEKNVEWLKETGTITRMNLDPIMMPWREYLAKYKDIMIVTRHRKGARKFSQDLTDIAIPHTFEKDTLHTWKEAKFVYDYYRLASGETITVKHAQRLLAGCNVSSDLIDALPSRKRVSKEMLPISFEKHAWPFVGNQRRLAKLRQFVNRDGWQGLAKTPRISISTMHGAKGREADLVIIVPDCTATVRENLNKPAELRLAYVAMTRAKKEVMIMLPRGDLYIHHFFGG